MNEGEINESAAASFLRAHDGYLILTHVRPDGDTIGCAAGLCLALRKLQKKAYVLYNPGITNTYAEYLEGLYAPPEFDPDTVVAVDIATAGLLDESAEPYAGRVDLCIDHHGSNTFYASRTWVDPKLSSCGELLYKLCRILDVLDEKIARVLYVAVSTDTGCFVYSNTSPNTHWVAAELMSYGNFAPAINKKCFRTKSATRLMMESLLMTGAEFRQNGAVAVGTITMDMMKKLKATEQDVEDIAAFLGQIEGVRISATLREMRPNHCKISLRTDASLNASRVCALLGGGGHPAASGAEVDLSPAKARAAVYDAICKIQAEDAGKGGD